MIAHDIDYNFGVSLPLNWKESQKETTTKFDSDLKRALDFVSKVFHIKEIAVNSVDIKFHINVSMKEKEEQSENSSN